MWGNDRETDKSNKFPHHNDHLSGPHRRELIWKIKRRYNGNVSGYHATTAEKKNQPQSSCDPSHHQECSGAINTTDFSLQGSREMSKMYDGARPSQSPPFHL